MELAIPFVALSGLYIIYNKKNNSPPSNTVQSESSDKEQFTNMGIRTNLQTSTPQTPHSNYLPNTNTPPVNYPTMNNKELVDTTTSYPTPNVATATYLNQNGSRS